MKIRLIILVLVLFHVFKAASQEDNTSTRGILIGYAFNNENFKDTRLTFRNRVESGFTGRILFFWGKNQNRHSVELSFGKNVAKRKKEMVAFTNLRPELIYTYHKKIATFLVGGYFDVGSLLSFPVGLWAGNNSISYTNWSSLGLSVELHKRLPYNKERFAVLSRLRTPIVSYVTRPSYGLPYPTGFVEDGVFDFQRTGMGKYVLSSGEITSFNRFQKVYFELGLTSRFTKKQHEVGLSYVLDYLKVRDVKGVRQVKNSIQVFSEIKF